MSSSVNQLYLLRFVLAARNKVSYEEYIRCFEAYNALCASHILPLVTVPVHLCTISTPFLEHTALAAISALGTNRTHCHLCPTSTLPPPPRSGQRQNTENECILPGINLHLSQVKHVRVKCLAQGHNIEIMSQYHEY